MDAPVNPALIHTTLNASTTVADPIVLHFTVVDTNGNPVDVAGLRQFGVLATPGARVTSTVRYGGPGYYEALVQAEIAQNYTLRVTYNGVPSGETIHVFAPPGTVPPPIASAPRSGADTRRGSCICMV